MTEVYVGIGSNVEAERHLRAGLTDLSAAYGVLRLSAVYRNPAVGFSGEDFLNLVAAFATDASLETVIRQLADIEYAHGRDPDAPRCSPRTLDIDLLLYGDRVVDSPGIRLPRPEILEQAYVLRPLVELAGELTCPETGRTYADHWAGFGAKSHPMERVELPLTGTSPASG